MIRAALAIGLALVAITGCGLRGDLDRPMPLWGDPPLDGADDPRVIKAAEDALKAEEERKAAARRAENEARRQQLEQQATPAAAPVPAPAPATPQ